MGYLQQLLQLLCIATDLSLVFYKAEIIGPTNMLKGVEKVPLKFWNF
jgi:hypothetical protein